MHGEGPSDLPRFAADLRELWIRAGKPSYRTISQDLEVSTGRFYSKSVIGDVLAGRRPPKCALLVDVVDHLGGDPLEWSDRLAEVLRPAAPAVAAVRLRSGRRWSACSPRSSRTGPASPAGGPGNGPIAGHVDLDGS